MHLVLVLPQLLALPPTILAGVPALARLARYSSAPRAFAGGLDLALLGALGMPGDAPVAPLAALGAGLDPGDLLVMRADPVHFIAGRDAVRLAGRIDNLSAEDARALILALNGHFSIDGIAFHAPRPDAWFLTAALDEPPRTTPLPAVSGAIHEQLPGGADAARWRRWLGEIQMLLHDAAPNRRREADGLVPANGIWFSGGGRLRDCAIANATFYASAPRYGDVARGLARHGGNPAQALPSGFTALPPGESTVAVLPAAHDPETLQALQTHWLGPAVNALEASALASLSLAADADGGVGHVWQARPPRWMARLSARFALAPFAPPAGTDDA